MSRRLANPEVEAALGGDARAAGAMSASDLAELVGAFSEVTGRLEQTHNALKGEVGRLRAELRETKGQLARARELAALGEMAAGIAHEVRNPLGSIRLYAEALVQDLGDRPDERGVAKRIVSSVVRLNAIVGDVLAFSRELSLRAEAVDIAALMHESIESCRARAEERGIELRWWAPPDDGSGPGEPMGDAGLLRQALVNIVSNAVDAAADGGCDARIVEVSAHTATIRDAEGGRAPAVSLRVDDSGAGIPSEVRERMFNPFFTTRETGTGLGLAIVHRIVDAHGGAIVIGDRGVGGGDGDGAGSWPGGARVEIKLPLAVAAGRGAGEGGGAVSLVEGKGRGGARRPAGAAVEVKSGAGHGSRLGGTVPSEAGGVGGSAGRAPESCSKEGQA